MNPYDQCVINKDIDWSQCTVALYVGNLIFLTSTKMLLNLSWPPYDTGIEKESPLTIIQKDIYKYLRMTIDSSNISKVVFSMVQSIEKI